MGKITIQSKRVYDLVHDSDGYRVLVDRLWPRGFSKEKIKINLWCKELAPSNMLCQWLDGDVKRWDKFKKNYLIELGNKHELIREILFGKNRARVTLLYSSKDTELNYVSILQQYMENIFDTPLQL